MECVYPFDKALGGACIRLTCFAVAPLSHDRSCFRRDTNFSNCAKSLVTSIFTTDGVLSRRAMVSEDFLGRPSVSDLTLPESCKRKERETKLPRAICTHPELMYSLPIKYSDAHLYVFRLPTYLARESCLIHISPLSNRTRTYVLDLLLRIHQLPVARKCVPRRKVGCS